MRTERGGRVIGPTSTRDLTPPEFHFLVAMRQMVFGRIEFIRIEHGQIVLDPWPHMMRSIKFGSGDPSARARSQESYELKIQVIEFFTYVRSVDVGEIRLLEVHHGLPFSMEIELQMKGLGKYRG